MVDSMRVWKYELAAQPRQTVEIPLPAEILHVGFMGRGLFLWAMVDPEAPTDSVLIEVVGTGEELEDLDEQEARYPVGTAIQHGLVLHVFQIRERPEGYRDE
jgi:hypothetical protein